MGNRALAHIEKITEIHSILCEGEPANSIEFARVLDFYVVVGKNQFKVGDLVVFIDVDSILPEKPEFEGLRKKKFIIKAMKMGSKFTDLKGRRIISQGIIFSTEELKNLLGELVIKEGHDVTDILGITKVVEDAEEDAKLDNTKPTLLGTIHKKLMRIKLYRKLYLQIATKKIKGTWAEWMPSQSDETNVQHIFSRVKEKYGDQKWIVCEKLEGQNMSIYKLNSTSWFGLKKSVINGVCSRTRNIVTDDGSQFWNTTKSLELFDKINKLDGEYLVRGEHCGPGIQKNIYKLKTHEFYVFEIWDIKNQGFLKFNEMVETCQKIGLKTVPVLDMDYVLPETSTDVLEYSNGKSALYDTLREGVVFRIGNDQLISMKARSPVYLAKDK